MINNTRHFRRQFLTGVAASAALIAFSKKSEAQGSAEPATSISPDTWMQNWINRTKPVSGALWLFRFSDPVYVVTSPLQWRSEELSRDGLREVTVPSGFVTDLASIPQVFWSLLRPDGTYAYAAIVHDYLYWTQNGTRDAADLTLLRCMEDMRVPSHHSQSIYQAVRAFGESAWKLNAKLRTSGERRLLAKFPEDPNVSWEDWKKRQDVFR